MALSISWSVHQGEILRTFRVPVLQEAASPRHFLTNWWVREAGRWAPSPRPGSAGPSVFLDSDLLHQDVLGKVWEAHL